MRFSLRTLMIVMSVACLFFGWNAFLRRMAAYHRAKENEAEAAYRQLVSEHPGIVPRVFWEHDPVLHHANRARDFDHALLRPWLVFVHCKPGSILGAPIQPGPRPPIVKRLSLRDDGPQVGDY